MGTDAQNRERGARCAKRQGLHRQDLRQRRPRFGELIQIDGSPHDWFEGRGPRCTLIVFIDDATGRLTALRFAPVESGQAYLAALRDHVLTHGRPLAFYSDRHGIFRVNAKDAASGDGKTEFGRVVERLKIGLIHALTPQAKGRVERANQTLQDRLIKEMRLCNISSMEEAQAFLPSFILGLERQVCGPAERPGTFLCRVDRASSGSHQAAPVSGRRAGRRHGMFPLSTMSSSAWRSRSVSIARQKPEYL